MLIVGAGAIGSLFAADACIKLGNSIRIVLATRANKKTSDGIGLVDNILYRTTRELPVSRLPIDTLKAQQFDVALLACKQFDHESCSAQLRDLDVRLRTCITLSNGLECKEAVIRGGVKCSEIIPAVTYAGAKLIDKLTVERTGLGDLVLVRPSNASDAELIQRAFPNVVFSKSHDEFAKQIWKKLLANCVINPLTALIGCKNGEVPTLAPKLVSILCEEFAKVCPYELDLDGSSPKRFIEIVCERTSANTSSMLADVQKGRRTEIEALNGALLRLAEQKGLQLPCHASLYELIKAKERTFSSSS